MAAMLGVFAVAMVKAIVPIFQFTEGTRFQVYIQDPVLYTVGPLYCGYMVNVSLKHTRPRLVAVPQHL